MRVDLFDFHLPPERIADRPMVPREAARLLRVTRDGRTDMTVGDLPSELRQGDVLVVNESRVIPARLYAVRGTGKVEVLLNRRLGPSRWEAFARPAKRLHVTDWLVFGEGLAAVVLGRRDELVELKFDQSDERVLEGLQQYGHVPLPPYLRRPDDEQDRLDYQTVYARQDGSVAAPTAGLHLTPALLTSIENAGVRIVPLTLHVGAGTFQPVKVDDTARHRMHPERWMLSHEAATAINAARAAGGRVVAVGTTVLRTLESAIDEYGLVGSGSEETNLFITPGYEFRVADLLLTNFHLPRSTLFMLVCAFAGYRRMQAAYAHAIASGYRFYSYGDACLLTRDPKAEEEGRAL